MLVPAPEAPPTRALLRQVLMKLTCAHMGTLKEKCRLSYTFNKVEEI